MSSALLVCFILLVAPTAFCRPSDPQKVKWYDVNLDEPAKTRWGHILSDYKKFVPEIKATVRSLVPPELIPLAEVIAKDIESLIPSPFAQEMVGVAGVFGMDVGEIIALNIIYDLTAYCTSIVSQDKNGVIWHARNLDYYYGDLLRNMTINTVYTGTTYAGYVGLVSGQRPHGFTVTVDQRGHHVHVGYWWQNILMAILDKKSSFVSFLLRQVFEQSPNFDDAVDKLSETPIHAPVYYIVGGVNQGEGVVITRDRFAAVDQMFINLPIGRWYVLETNYDNWTTPPPYDKQRRAMGKQCMDGLGEAGINKTSLFKVISTNPVMNANTTYSMVMSAAQPSVYASLVRWP